MAEELKKVEVPAALIIAACRILDDPGIYRTTVAGYGRLTGVEICDKLREAAGLPAFHLD